MKRFALTSFRILAAVQGALWVCFSVFGSDKAKMLPLALLMFLNGCAFVSAAIFAQRLKRAKWLPAVFLAVNLLLTITDQMGAFDYIVLVLNIATIAAFVLSFVYAKRKQP